MGTVLTLKDFGSVEPSFVAEVPIQTSPKFSFVAFQKPGDLKDKAKRSAIRQHAKRNVDRKKLNEQRSRIELISVSEKPRTTPVAKDAALQSAAEIDTPDVDQPHAAGKGSANDEDIDVTCNDTRLGSVDIWRPLGAGRGLTPFAPYPVQPTQRATQLIDYMLRVEGLYFKPIRLLWVNIAMSDRDAFNITLAHAANLLMQTQKQTYGETDEALQYYTIAMQAVSKRLRDSKDSTSDGVLGTILGFACLDITYQNWQRWQAHMAGVQKIFQLRFGSGAVSLSYELEMTAFWNDITGSLNLDTPPRFPMPLSVQAKLHGDATESLENMIALWTVQTPEADSLGESLNLLAQLSSYINQHGIGNESWEQELFVATKVYPVAYHLLSVPRYNAEDALDTARLDVLAVETTRRAALLFVSLLKAFCNGAVPCVVENQNRLATMLPITDMDWFPSPDLYLWVLTLSAIAAQSDRDSQVGQVAALMKALGLAAWQDVLEVLKQLIWIDAVFEKAAADLGLEVEAYRNMSPISSSSSDHLST